MAQRCDADAVVIGAGPNGLVAANELADAGWSVIVLEGQATPGGAVRSAPLIEPGFVNDLCSAFYPFAAASPVFARLELERWGLTWCRAPLALAHPQADGSCTVLSTSLEETAAGLGCPEDAVAWRELHHEWQEVREPLLRCLLGPFPPLRGGARLAATLRRDLLRFVRFSLLPVRRLGEERFRGEPARLLLAGAALHSDLAPEAALSGFLGWLLCMIGQDDGFPVPAGGAQSLTDALVARLGGRGRLRCGEAVERIVTRRGRAVGVRLAGGEAVIARHAVLADVDAPTLYGRLVEPGLLPAPFRADMGRFHWDRSTVKVDWNLDRPIPWTADAARRAGTVHLADSVDELTETESQLVRGLLPARPFLLVGQHATTDASRYPAGCDTVWAYTHVPQSVRGDAGAEWTGHFDAEAVERFADRMQERIEAFAPGFEAAIRGRHVAGPAELEGHDPNLVGGAVAGGTSQLHQMLLFRPTPGMARAETPIPGLFLASASAHPGGAVHGAPGANAARAARLHALLPRRDSLRPDAHRRTRPPTGTEAARPGPRHELATERP
jgi:phytoene dehydrogenase-like protein